MATTDKLLTAEEFFTLPDNGMPTELIDGRIVELSPAGGSHGYTAYTVARKLGNYVDERDLGYVLVSDPGIVLARNPDRVRAPDVCYFAKDRLPNGPPDEFIEVMPDFVIEVISLSDRPGEVRQKADEWRAAGVRLVWNMYRRTRTITAETPDSETVYHEDDIITGAPVLPDFRIRVADLFG